MKVVDCYWGGGLTGLAFPEVTWHCDTNEDVQECIQEMQRGNPVKIEVKEIHESESCAPMNWRETQERIAWKEKCEYGS